MRNIKCTIEYDGTNYKGWQIQGNKQATVQGILEKALTKICKEKIRVYGSGRTDSGVHAHGQVANFKTHTTKSTSELKKALNANLPDDISVINITEVNDAFHAQYNARSKHYRYTILNRDVPSVKDRHYYLYYPYKLNISSMRNELKSLIGRKDFKSFQSNDPKKNGRVKKGTTIRNIRKAQIRKRGDYIYMDFEANGFLYKMVRNMVGTLIDVGRGRLNKGSIKEILSKKNRIYAGSTAKACGLTLEEVEY